MLDNSILERLLDAATHHGRDSEPDHEVGDLQDYLRAMWGLLTLDQRQAFLQLKEVRETLETGLGEDASAALLAEAFQL
jgi:hypothetical protein